MKLKKLEIFGFKSFAERTHMTFDKGITGVVGPNGSGKSNISDAVRWVLGEQSAKILRGSKMEDVIFGGTEKRKPLAYCEVSLTLDNADGALPVQFSEVLVTRRVYRNGDSEYFLNKSACRLKDIIDLFRDTGIGKEGYSLIGQGRIDEILSAKGEERRAVFEEAAGIAKYKARKGEAERKIDNTNQNLTRVEDIIAESERQLGPLEKQAQKAKQYIQLFDELRALDISQFVARYAALNQRISAQQSAADERTSAVADAQNQYDKIKNQRDQIDRLQAAADELTKDLRAEVVELTRQSEEKQGQLKLIEERLQAAARESERLLGEKHKALDALEAMRARSEQLSRAQSDQTDESRKLQEELAVQDAQLTERVAEIDKEAQRIEDRKESLMEAINRLSDVKSARARLTAMRQAIGERIESCQRECDSLHAQQSALGEVKAEGAAQLQAAQQKLEAIRESMRAIEQNQQANRQQREQAQARQQEISLNRQQTETRLKVLREMQRDYEGYQFAVKQVMLRARQTNDSGIIGVVANVLRVPKELERAADMVLGAALQNIIVETEQDAKRMIEYLRTNKYGRATFLPVSAVTGRTLSPYERQALDTEGCLGVLSELVQFDEKYQGIVDNLLGRTVVARDLDAGIEIMRKGRQAFRLVTLEGDVMHSGGSMTGGSVQSRVTNLLSRDREIAEHESLLKKLDAQLKNIEQKQTTLGEERTRLHGQRDTVEQQQRAGENDVLRLTQQLKQIVKENVGLVERTERMETERDNLKINLDDVVNELGGLTGQQGAAESNHEQMQREIAENQKELAVKRQELEAQREKLTQKRILLAERVRDENSRLSEIKRLSDETEARQELLQRIIADIESGERNKYELSVQITRGKEELDGANRLLGRKKAELDAADGDNGARTQKRKQLEEQLEARQRDISGFTEQLHKFEMQIDRARAELDNLQQRIWKDYEMTYEACAEQADTRIQLADADKRIVELRGQIRALGSVNVNAAQEFDEASKRYTELTAQRDDLLNAQKDLQKIIGDLTSQMKAQFVQQFELLNEHFQTSFKALFGGGSARLILQDENDVLNCGIDIAAQPPGKKLQMLTLLSGGERALTAIAILFAMLDIRPTPFCMLDEIEAALDDANIDNFAQYLSRYSEKTQFIVVTHRKGTMECCDSLYGVAMEEKGVSRMVSVALADARRAV